MFKNAKIGRKLAWAFGIALAIMVGTVVISLISIKAMADKVTNLNDHALVIAVKSQEMKIQILQTRIEMDEIVDSKDSVAVSEAKKRIDEYKLKFDQDAEVVRSNYLGDKNDLVQVVSIFEQWQNVLENIISLKDSGKNAEASALYEERGGKILVSALGASEKFIEESSSRTALYIEDTKKAMSQAIIILIGILVSNIIVSMLISRSIGASIVVPIKKLVGAMGEASKGNLAVQFEKENRKDELGQLMDAFEVLLSSFRNQTIELVSSISQLSSTSSEMSATASQLQSLSTESAASITETASTVEEVKQTAQISMDRAKDVFEAAQVNLNVSKEGLKFLEIMAGNIRNIKEQMDHIAQSILSLNDQSQTISEIISAVDDIAEQSNLLAVNASIEAAKAGEHGRGFTVVAQEIKTLADQSKQSTKQVRKILGDIQKATGTAVMATEQGNKAADAGVSSSAEVERAIKNLSETIAEATQLSQQITAANQQQYAGIDQVTIAMENIKEASTQNVQAARNLEQSGQDLKDLSLRLKALVDMYTV